MTYHTSVLVKGEFLRDKKKNVCFHGEYLLGAVHSL